MNLKKGLKLITILTFIFTLVVPLFQSGIKAEATELNNIVDSVTVTHQDGSTTGNYDFYEGFTSHFTWSAKSNDLKNGDTFTVELGDNIYVANSITFPLMTEDNQMAGEVVVDAKQNLMTVTFNNYVEGRANVKGTIELQDYFSIETIKVETVIPLTYIFNGETETVNVNVNPTPVADPDELLIKGGTISQDDTSIINWNSRINFANKVINNAVIVDTLGPGQEFIQDSVILTKQAFDEYGLDIPPSSVVPISDYAITFDSPTKMTILLGNINESYRLTYQTKITDSSLSVYTNNITISGDNIDTRSLDVESDTTSGSGTAGGDYGSFELTKVDQNNHAITLENAEFTLVSDISGTSYKLITNTSGKSSLSNLPLGDYTLTETKAPAGYEINTDPVKITINSATNTTYTFENTKTPPANGALEVTKVDSKDATMHLVDAEFNVIDSDGDVVTSVTTDAEGKANLSSLTPGDYQLIETKAPIGYELDSTPIALKVKSDVTTKVIVENTKTPPSPVTPAPPVTPIPQAPATPEPNPPAPSKPSVPTKPKKKITVKELEEAPAKKLPKTGDRNQTMIFVVLGAMLLVISYRMIQTKKVN